jgi:hypothetical protein
LDVVSIGCWLVANKKESYLMTDITNIIAHDSNMIKIYICRPYWRHLTEKFPLDFKHQIHKWTAGIILIDHTEPEGKSAKDHHIKYIIKEL